MCVCVCIHVTRGQEPPSPHPPKKQLKTYFCEADFVNADSPPQPSRSDDRVGRGG